jgi:hypothetical protein
MNKDTILGIVRHALTFGGGILASKGLASSDEISGGIGALVTLIGVIWSIVQKKNAAKALEAARQ